MQMHRAMSMLVRGTVYSEEFEVNGVLSVLLFIFVLEAL